MKKIVALLLMSVMMLALTGCGGSDKKDEKAAGSDMYPVFWTPLKI